MFRCCGWVGRVYKCVDWAYTSFPEPACRTSIGRMVADVPLPSTRRMFDALFRLAFSNADVSASDLATDWRKLVYMKEPKRKKFIRILVKPRVMGRLFVQFVQAMRGVPFPPDEETVQRIIKDAEGKNEPGESEFIAAFFSSCEGQYFFRVWIPCWVLYHTYPPTLLAKARRGDIDALDMLIRLDKAVASDPRIARHVHSLIRSNDESVRKRITRALADPPQGRLDKARIKTLLGGFISQLAIGMKCPVTASEIEDLFDVLHLVRAGENDEVDPDISGGDNFSKAVRLNRVWPSLPRK